MKCLYLIDAAESDLGIVIGCGIMGLLNIMTAKALGTPEIWAVEPNPVRAQKAREIGANRVLHPSEMREIAQSRGFDGADYVIVGPGFPPVIQEATSFVRGGGSVLLIHANSDRGADLSRSGRSLFP